MRILMLFPVCALLVGCASFETTTAVHKIAQPLDRGAQGLVATPPDGQYGNIKYDASGRMTAEAVSSAFSRYLVRAEICPTLTDFNGGVSSARTNKFSYFIWPEILHWEDRATEWSGKPDRIEIKIAVVEAATGEVLDSSLIRAKSAWATFGGDHPQDLLAKPINEYVDGLFGVFHKNSAPPRSAETRPFRR
jgi:hypothetical protein